MTVLAKDVATRDLHKTQIVTVVRSGDPQDTTRVASARIVDNARDRVTRITGPGCAGAGSPAPMLFPALVVFEQRSVGDGSPDEMSCLLPESPGS